MFVSNQRESTGQSGPAIFVASCCVPSTPIGEEALRLGSHFGELKRLAGA